MVAGYTGTGAGAGTERDTAALKPAVDKLPLLVGQPANGRLTRGASLQGTAVLTPAYRSQMGDF